MERMGQQAARQAKMPRKGDNLSALQYITISEKGKTFSSLIEETLQDQKKNLCFPDNLLLQSRSQMLSPVLCQEVFLPWLQEPKTGHLHDGVSEVLAAVPWSAASACPHSRLRREWDVE